MAYNVEKHNNVFRLINDNRYVTYIAIWNEVVFSCFSASPIKGLGRSKELFRVAGIPVNEPTVGEKSKAFNYLTG